MPQISFKTSQEFFDGLTELSKSKHKSKKQIIEDAVLLYAKDDILSPTPSYSKLVEEIKNLDLKSTNIQEELNQIKILLFQILSNQQGV